MSFIAPTAALAVLFLQVEVLKYNLEKADQEIHQLDDIVDKVVTVRPSMTLEHRKSGSLIPT